jgi:putative NADPH-quinone reductase/putative sterol carrier protein
MKVLALNGSPRRRVSATFRLLDALLAGMRDAGAETELVHLGDLDLRPCTGCYTCWVRTPGDCIHDDGMARAAQALAEADLVVFGTPLYHYSMTGLMKTFLDRLLPQAEPWLIEDARQPGLTSHPQRRAQRTSRAMLVSPCGFPEAEHFRPLVETFRYIAGRHGWRWLGELLRPGAEPLSRRALLPLFADYLADVRRAGAAWIRDGELPGELAEALARDLFPGGRAAFRAQANIFWQDLMARHRRPAGLPSAPLTEDDLDPPDDPGLSCRTLVAGMAARFDPVPAPGLDARIEFRIDGGEPGRYHLAIAAGSCRFVDGAAPAPTLTIEAPAEVWSAIAVGARDGRRALLDGAYRASGDLGLLLKLGQLFGRAAS